MALKKVPILLLLVLLIGGLFAQNYSMDLVTVSSGGSTAGNSTNYAMEDVVGIVAGLGNSTNYINLFGLFLFGSNNTQNVTTGVNITLTYPANNSVFGPNQCWTVLSENESDTGSIISNRVISCSLYSTNGSIGAPWVLNSTLTTALGGYQNFNFTTSVSGMYLFNCTATVDGFSNVSQSTQFQVIGASFCPGGVNSSSTDATVIFVAMLVLIAIIWQAGMLSEILAGFMAVFTLLGAITYGGIISVPAGLPNMYQIFIFFFIIFGLGLAFALLFMLIGLVAGLREQFNKKGKNA